MKRSIKISFEPSQFDTIGRTVRGSATIRRTRRVPMALAKGGAKNSIVRFRKWRTCTKKGNEHDEHR